jgi:curved DNA-binding protein
MRQYARWGGGGGGGAGDEAGGFGFDFSSIFEHLQNNGRRGSSPFASPFGQSMPVRGRDLEQEVTIDFARAVRGGEVTMLIHGEDVKVRLPPGVKEGSRLRVAGKGLPSSNGGERGDLMLEFHVREHDWFWLEDNDLHVRVPITVGEAFRGGKVKVPTVDGEVTVKVPPNSNSETKLRVAGRGVPAGKKTQASDLIVHLQIALPKMDDSLKDAVDAIEKSYTTPVREKLEL